LSWLVILDLCLGLLIGLTALLSWDVLSTFLVLEKTSRLDRFASQCFEGSDNFVTIAGARIRVGKETEFVGIDDFFFVACIVEAAVDFFASTVDRY